MSVNVKNPLYLTQHPGYTDTIKLAVAGTPSEGYIGLTLGGALPALLGDKVAGIVGFYDEKVEYAGVIQAGVAIVKINPTAVVPVNSPLTIGTNGYAVVAAGAESVVGYALDESTGTGTVLEPHYTRVNLEIA